tara:strand:- start:621 stop:1277 length:657 start_codon:yes stop_codon:yes gene_type:complete
LFQESPFQHQACDLFADNIPGALQYDLNDLSALGNILSANVVTCIRASMFIKSKRRFIQELTAFLQPGAYLIMDFLIGSSDLPVLDFRYDGKPAAAIYDVKRPSVFATTFYDERLLMEQHLDDVNAFCEHARGWPIKTQLRYMKAHPIQFFKTFRGLQGLDPHNLGEAINSHHDSDNVMSLKDLELSGFTIEKFDTHYFYEEVGKFNLFILVVAKYRQ